MLMKYKKEENRKKDLEFLRVKRFYSLGGVIPNTGSASMTDI